MKTYKNYKEIWKQLPFTEFDDKELLEKKLFDWYKYAEILIEALNDYHPAFIANTAAGKTIIAFLIIAATECRCIMTCPTKILCQQHYDLWTKITGENNNRVLHGEIPIKKRDWNDLSNKVVFSTPHALYNDLKRGVVNLDQFDFIIFDEFHKASGNYPYVSIMPWVLNSGCRRLGLSAGGSIKKVEIAMDNCHFNKFIGSDIKTPKKVKSTIVAQLNKNLIDCEKMFKILLQDCLIELTALEIKYESKEILTNKEINQINEQIDAMRDDLMRRTAISILARYRKLLYAYNTLLTESYYTFLRYVKDKLEKSDKTKAAKFILQSKNFQNIRNIALKNINTHPKTDQALKVIESWTGMAKNGIVFVNNKNTAHYLCEMIRRKNISAEILSGGKGRKKIIEQQTILNRLKNNELQIIIATSVIEEGISVPEVDAIFHFSLSITEISRIQRDGRTGRLKVGHVIYFILDHPLEKNKNWAILRAIKNAEAKMQKPINPKIKAFKAKQLYLF